MVYCDPEEIHATAVSNAIQTTGGKLAVITCHFNWCNFARPRSNLHRFLRQMDASRIPVYGVEAVLPGQVAQTTGRVGWQQITVSHHAQLFQKEALLNIAATLPPDEFTKLAWVDADVWFDNPHWYEITSQLLELAPVVQPFAQAVWTSRTGGDERKMPSAAKARSADPRKGHPGFAMAARRSMWKYGPGLSALSITGAGDVLFSNGAFGDGFHGQPKKAVGSNPSLYLSWLDQFKSWMAGEKKVIDTLYVPGSCYHEWHGDFQNRGYTTRHDVLEIFDAEKHLTKAREGHLEWTRETPPELMAEVLKYFSNRKEDG